MSSSIDERIVRLGFDNEKFEANASKSMSTLDKLKEKLQFKDAEKSVKSLDRSVSSVDFSKMLSGIESVEKRFSSMGIAGMNVVNKITDSVINGAKQLEQATIGQIKSGGWSRAMNLANAQFQIEGLGEDWTEMQKAISYGVKDTAYGLDAAATAASSLVASGVEYKESIEGANDSLMHTSLRAISGVAAMTNSSYEDISRIFTTVAGNGRLMGDQLLQLSSRGMNAAATLASALGTTESEVRDMVSKGAIDFEAFATAMDNAFGEHAKEANKTFTGALSNMKAALSRFGAVFATPIIDKTNTLFISLTDRIDELKSRLGEIKVPRSIDELHEKLDEMNLTAAGFDVAARAISEKTINLGEDFAAMWQSGIDAFSALIEAVNLSWFDKIVEKVDTVVNKVKFFFDTLTEYVKGSAEDTADSVADATELLLISAEEAQAAREIIDKGLYGNGEKRHDALVDLFGGGEEGEQHAKNVQAYIDSVVAAGWDYEKAAIKVAEANDEIVEAEENITKKEHLKSIFDSIKQSGNNLTAAMKNIASVAVSVGKAILKGFGFDAASAGNLLVGFTEILVKISVKIRQIITPMLGSISVGVSNLWSATKNIFKSIKTIFKSIYAAFTSVFSVNTKSISNGIVGVTSNIEKLSEKLQISDSGAEKIYNAFVAVFKVIRNGFRIIKKVGSYVLGFFDSVASSSLFETIQEKVSGIIDFDPSKIANNPIVDLLKNIIDGIVMVIASIPGEDVLSKLSTFIGGVIDAIIHLNWQGIFTIAKKLLGLYGIFVLFKAFGATGSIFVNIEKFFSNIASMVSNASSLIKAGAKVAPKLAMAQVILSIAKAFALIAGSIISMSLVNPSALYSAVAVAITITVIVSVLMKSVQKMIDSSERPDKLRDILLNSIGEFSAILKALGAMALLAVSLGAAVALIMAGMSVVAASGAGMAEAGYAIIMLVALFAAVKEMLSTILSLNTKQLVSSTGAIAAVSLLFLSLGTAVLGVSAAAALMTIASPLAILSTIGIIALLLEGVIKIVEVESKVKPKALLSVAVTIAAIGSVMLTISAAAALMTIASPLAILSTIGIIALLLEGVIKIVEVESKVKPKALLSVAVTIAAIGAAVLVIAASLKILSGASNLISSAVALGIIIALIGTILAGLSQGSGTDGLLNVGIAFIGISAGLLILTVAIEKLSAITGGLWTAVGAFAALVGIIAIVATLSAIFPKFGEGLIAVGTAFISAGLGALLIGAGILLASEGFKKFAEAIAELTPHLEEFFTILEEHKVAAIALGVFIVAILALIVVGIVKLASIIQPIVTTVTTAITTILQNIGNFGKRMSSGVSKFGSTMSTKTKTMLVGIIGGILAAISASTPETLKTLGQIIIKVLSWLGSIAGDVAEGLLDFLINVINGLADAIMINSARITAALKSVLYAIADLVLNIIGELIASIADWFGAGEKVREFINGTSEELMSKSLAAREEAEKAAESKKALYNELQGIEEDTKQASSSSGSSLDGLSLSFGSLGLSADSASSSVFSANALMASSTEDSTLAQIQSVESLKEQYDSLPAAGQAAMLKSLQLPQNEAALAGSDAGSAWSDSSIAAMFGGSSDIDMEDYMAQMGLGTDDFSAYGMDSGDDFSEYFNDAAYDPGGMYDVTDGNISDGAIAAVEDNKSNIRDATRRNITDTMKATVKDGRGGMSEAGMYTISGLTQAIRDQKANVVAAIADLTEAMKAQYESDMDQHSPSKVFYENGKYLVKGLANGIDQSTKLATDSMSDLSDAVIVSFGAPLDYISKFASGELVYDSSIRPVFDLTGIKSGTQDIDSMVTSKQIQLSEYTGQLAADISELDNSNLLVVNELRELRADMAIMTKKVSGMQMVLDTGTLVGKISTQIDQDLGAKFLRKKRGI